MLGATTRNAKKVDLTQRAISDYLPDVVNAIQHLSLN
jgi:hypothetical protein